MSRAADKQDQEIREECARIVEATAAHMSNAGDKQWVQLALSIAARAVRRGRHLTVAERLENLNQALSDEASTDEAHADD